MNVLYRCSMDVFGFAGESDGTQFKSHGRNRFGSRLRSAGVPKDRFTAICAIAVGYRGTDEDIHPRMVKNNFANDRKELSEIAFKSSFNPEELQKSNYESKLLSS